MINHVKSLRGEIFARAKVVCRAGVWSRLRARSPRGLTVHRTVIQYPRFRSATPAEPSPLGKVDCEARRMRLRYVALKITSSTASGPPSPKGKVSLRYARRNSFRIDALIGLCCTAGDEPPPYGFNYAQRNIIVAHRATSPALRVCMP